MEDDDSLQDDVEGGDDEHDEDAADAVDEEDEDDRDIELLAVQNIHTLLYLN